MSDQPESVTNILLRRLDAKFDGMIADMADLKHRFTTLEVQVGNLAATEANHYAGMAQRIDRIEARLDRIERRLDLVEAP